MANTNGSEHHVHFDALDAAAEEERSARGQHDRKEMVRGIRWYKESEKTIRNIQIKAGFDWLKDMEKSSGLKDVSLGVRLTVHGFLASYHEANSAEGESTPEDLDSLSSYFVKCTKSIEDMGAKLQEYLVLIALMVCKEDLPLDDADITPEAALP